MPSPSAKPCILCENQKVATLSNTSRNGGTLHTVICQHCGLVWSDPFPHDPRQFYQNDYRLSYKNTYIPKAKHILRAGKVALERHGKIRHLLDQRRRFLDVGTGGGEFAYLIQSLGHDVHGIEPNQGYAEYAKATYALNLQLGFIQEASFANASFDVITIWHVLEHTENPLQVLGKLGSLLTANGVLVVEVPNVEATCQAPSSTFHEAHLFNFNLASLCKMAEKVGLIADHHVYSADHGNITVFFKPAAKPMHTDDFTLAGNADKISQTLQAHTHWRHFTRATPYLRFLRRMLRSLQEQLILLSHRGDHKALLDKLYASVCTA